MTEKEMIDDETGTRFHPNEEELVNHYLKRRVQGSDSKVNVPIAEVKVLQHEPWELPNLSKKKSNDPFWYFFYKLDYKYLKSKRVDRKTEAGCWKKTGPERPVTSGYAKQLIGSKKTLVFQERCVSKEVMDPLMNWVIHEYHVTSDVPNPDAYVICCLKKEPKKKIKGKAKKTEPKKKKNGKAEKKENEKASTSIPVEGESSHQSPSGFVNQVAENTIIEGEGACLADPPSQAQQAYIDDIFDFDFSDPIPQPGEYTESFYGSQYNDYPWEDEALHNIDNRSV